MEEIIYSKYSNERDPLFAIVTRILMDDKKNKFIRKEAIDSRSVAHINATYEMGQKLDEIFAGSSFQVNKCIRHKSNSIDLEFLEGITLEEKLDQLIYDGKKETALSLLKSYLREIDKLADKSCFEKTEQFIKVFGDVSLPGAMKYMPVSDIDLIVGNIIIKSGLWNIIDYEWTFDFPIPSNFIIFRVIHYYAMSKAEHRWVLDYKLMEEYGVDEHQETEFMKMEQHFQKYILGKHVPMRDMYSDISKGVIVFNDVIEKYRVAQNVNIAEVFCAADGNFTADRLIEYPLKNNCLNQVIELSPKDNSVRIDPCRKACVVELKQLSIKKDQSFCDYIANGIWLGGRSYFFETNDPMFVINNIPEGENRITVSLEVKPIIDESNMLNRTLADSIDEMNESMNELKETLKEKQEEINNIKSTKTWNIYKRIKGIREEPVITDKIYYAIDVMNKQEGYFSIQGWAIGTAGAVRLGITDLRDKQIEAKIERIFRSDVNKALEIEDKESKNGFNIYIPDNVDAPKIKIVFESGEARNEQTVNLKKMEFASTALGRLLKKMHHLNILKAFKFLLKNGPKKTIEKIKYKLKSAKDYNVWIEKHLPTKKEQNEQKNARFAYNPLISIVIPLYNTPIQYLSELIESIKAQTYSNWQLCLADASTQDEPGAYINERYIKDKRILYKRLSENSGISANTNEAIKMSTGEFICFSDHDDLLTPDALFCCIKALNQDNEIDCIYSDEDKITMDSKQYFQPHFKSDFNIDLLCSMNYICHLYVVRRSLMDKVGMLDPAFDGAQDHDFIFRSTEKARKIYHIPRILYHWRAHKNSTAENPESKLYAFEAGKRAVAAHYKRLGIPAEVSHGQYWGLFKTAYLWKEQPLISILIPNKDHTEDLDKCINSIETKSTYRNYEYIIIENNSTEPETFEYYKALEKKLKHAHVVYYKGDFNFSAINNFGANHANGDYYLLLNNDTEIINDDCLYQMLGYCMRDDVGAVGARLYYNDDTVQHAGVVIGFGGIAGHTFIGQPRQANGYFSRIICAQDYSAITAACLMVKKTVFDEVGGLYEGLKVAFNDIDFCMKIRAHGDLIVYNPYAELYHYESKSRGMEDTPEKVARFGREIAIFRERWPDILETGDPYYNENLSLNRSDFGLKEI